MELTDKIMPLAEFETLPEEEQLHLLGHWRNIHGVKGIREAWSIDPNNYYKIARRVGLPTSRAIDKSIPTAHRELSDARNGVAATTASPRPHKTHVSPAPSETSTSFSTTLIGEYSGQVIANRLMMLASLMLNDTDTKYTVNLKIESR